MNRHLPYKIIFPIVLIILFILLVFIISIYNRIYTVNVNTGNAEGKYFYIHTGSDFNDVVDSLSINEILIDRASFLWLAKKKNLVNHIYPGKYFIKAGMTNNELVNLLRSGKQEVIDLVINNIRTKNELAARVAKYLEADSNAIAEILNNEDFLKNYGYDTDDVMTIFIPNTYEFYWNTSAEGFFARMIKENDKFWNKDRLKKAAEIPLGRKEINILASIVQQETNFKDEMPDIAGVYINRLKKGMPLQADPTVVFATGDFSKKRVLKEDTKLDSPYNTYKYPGLPPGPICLPEPATIDAVLNYSNHNYFYFCAKEDLSGYHNFSRSLTEHLRNARKYQRALNKLKIKK